jgi:hypothetical protein
MRDGDQFDFVKEFLETKTLDCLDSTPSSFFSTNFHLQREKVLV